MIDNIQFTWLLGLTILLVIQFVFFWRRSDQKVVVGQKGEVGLIGPLGATGATGPRGPTGPQGPQGLTGTRGSIGPSGPQGATGPQGENGPSTGIVYYMNYSDPPGPTGAQELGVTPDFSTEAQITVTNAMSPYTLDFFTVPGVPDVTSFPAGGWQMNFWASCKDNTITLPYVEFFVYRYDGVSSTQISYTQTDPTQISNQYSVAPLDQNEMYSVTIGVDAQNVGTGWSSTDQLQVQIVVTVPGALQECYLFFDEGAISQVITSIPNSANIIPSGTIAMFGGPTGAGQNPTGWLFCDGTSYPTASYPDLFTSIGYTYGGSGANFKVPDLTTRFPIGFPGPSGSFTDQKGGSSLLVATDLPPHAHAIVEAPTGSLSVSATTSITASLTAGQIQAATQHLHNFDHTHQVNDGLVNEGSGLTRILTSNNAPVDPGSYNLNGPTGPTGPYNTPLPAPTGSASGAYTAGPAYVPTGPTATGAIVSATTSATTTVTVTGATEDNGGASWGLPGSQTGFYPPFTLVNFIIKT